MFDDVSDRYDLLNRVMALGQDGAWRRAMWREVPEGARVVLDLCTGTGVSLSGLRRPGRLLMGVDVSRRMLVHAMETFGRAGWAPRLVCADAFQLPLRDASVDAITIAFGIRNLRPRLEALQELARVLEPGGTLVVLEATAPAPGPAAPLHAFYLSRLIPLAGRLSHDPSAYAYLSRSVVEFGAGPEFERDLAAAGFRTTASTAFMLGATRLWTATRGGAPARDPATLQPARLGELPRGEMRTTSRRDLAEWRAWQAVQLALALALLVVLVIALFSFSKYSAGLPLEDWQRRGMRGLLALGVVGFAVRTVILWGRFRGLPPRV